MPEDTSQAGEKAKELEKAKKTMLLGACIGLGKKLGRLRKPKKMLSRPTRGGILLAKRLLGKKPTRPQVGRKWLMLMLLLV